MNAPVIVGFDGSRSAHAAVRYGADEAVLRDRELRIVHAFRWPLIYPPLDSEYDPHERGPRVAMLNRLTQTARDVQQNHPHLPVSIRLFDGSPGGVLVAASRDAELLIVGHRAPGGFTGLLAGSVGVQTTGHAHCPVVVVRGDVRPGAALIVLGVDGSADARCTADAAFAQAQRRGAEVLVAYRPPTHPRWPAMGPQGNSSVVDEFVLSLRDAARRYPDVKYRTEVVVHGDSAATALIAAAQRMEAGLLVVGSRGVGGFHGLMMGSTFRSLIEHASCPVMVIPAAAHPRPTPMGVSGIDTARRPAPRDVIDSDLHRL